MPTPEALCSAVQDVVGLEFSAASPADVAAAAVLAQKLAEDPQQSGGLASRLIHHGPPLNGAPLPDLGNLNFRTVAGTAASSSIADEDKPTRSVPPTAGVPLRADSLRSFDLESLGPVDAFVLRKPKLGGIKRPEFLGFAGTIDWSGDPVSRWRDFLQDAEGRLTARISVFQRLRNLVGGKKIAMAEHVAKNYSFVNLMDGGNKLSCHVLFDNEKIYYLVVNNQRQVRHTCNIDQLDLFTRDFLSAFDGNEGDARSTLASLRVALA